jgi:hypothetical protein
MSILKSLTNMVWCRILVFEYYDLVFDFLSEADAIWCVGLYGFSISRYVMGFCRF